ERDFWYTMARSSAGLEPPEQVGRIAAERTLRRLKPVKMGTQKVPVVFEPRVARSLLDNIFEAVHGMSVYRHESFMAGKLGERVAGENVTVIDDATIPGLFGTSPFDDEGVPSRRTAVIENGVLKSYLLNCYAARKLGMKTTGNAARGLTGNAGIGHGNLYLEKGVQTPERIIASVKNGFYVTELLGFGVNVVTGDYSRGAAGLWIRDGELAFGLGSDDCRKAERDADGCGGDRERPGISRLGGGAEDQSRRNDGWRKIRRQSPKRSALRSRRWRSLSPWCWR